MEVSAQIIFADMRRFTTWAGDTEVFANLGEFVFGFLDLIEKSFPKADFIKSLGDGALIVQENKEKRSTSPGKDLATILKSIKLVEEGFDKLCKDFGHSIGHETILKLGWSIVRGKIQKIQRRKVKDYVGPNVNKGSRLCDHARPQGIVIDRADFPEPPGPEPYKFYEQIRKLVGIGEVQVWVSGEAASEFVIRERLRQCPEVHVAGLCIDTNGKKGLRILLAKRSPDRILFPDLFEGCGGQLARSETFSEGVARHYRLELHLEVKVLESIHCFYVINHMNEGIIPGIRFLCERVSTTDPHSLNHTEFLWASETELKNMPATIFVGGLRNEALQLIKQYRALNR